MRLQINYMHAGKLKLGRSRSRSAVGEEPEPEELEPEDLEPGDLEPGLVAPLEQTVLSYPIDQGFPADLLSPG